MKKSKAKAQGQKGDDAVPDDQPQEAAWDE